MRFTLDEGNLLIHARAMGGWLSGDYCDRTSDRRQALAGLIAMQPPMFERQTMTNRAETIIGVAYYLTDAGDAEARELERMLATATFAATLRSNLFQEGAEPS